VLPDAATQQFLGQACGPLLDQILKDASDNIAVMDRSSSTNLDTSLVAEQMTDRFYENLNCGHDPEEAAEKAFQSATPKFLTPLGTSVADVPAMKAELARLE
jgi:hypothetical protein